MSIIQLVHQYNLLYRKVKSDFFFTKLKVMFSHSIYLTLLLIIAAQNINPPKNICTNVV